MTECPFLIELSVPSGNIKSITNKQMLRWPFTHSQCIP